ncbi:MAG: hypothetical protein KDD69_08025 [Bdellovibrionales bacterium]|nr:hypothetical protein [Bdellovibrionales bacterium]
MKSAARLIAGRSQARRLSAVVDSAWQIVSASLVSFFSTFCLAIGVAE